MISETLSSASVVPAPASELPVSAALTLSAAIAVLFVAVPAETVFHFVVPAVDAAVPVAAYPAVPVAVSAADTQLQDFDTCGLSSLHSSFLHSL